MSNLKIAEVQFFGSKTPWLIGLTQPNKTKTKTIGFDTIDINLIQYFDINVEAFWNPLELCSVKNRETKININVRICDSVLYMLVASASATNHIIFTLPDSVTDKYQERTKNRYSLSRLNYTIHRAQIYYAGSSYLCIGCPKKMGIWKLRVSSNLNCRCFFYKI